MALNGKCNKGMDLDRIYNSVIKTGKDYAKGARSRVEQKTKDSSTGEHGSYENSVVENVIRMMDEYKMTANYKNEENHVYENVFREIEGLEVNHLSTGKTTGEYMYRNDDNPVYENVIRKTTEELIQHENHNYEYAIRKQTEEGIQCSIKGKGAREENYIYENVIRKTTEQEIQELARQTYQSGENGVYEYAIRKTIEEDIPSSSRGKCEMDESPVYENVTRKIDKQDTTNPPIIKQGAKAVQAYESVPDAVIKNGHYEADNEIEPITNLNQ